MNAEAAGILRRVEAFVRTHRLFTRGDTLVIACSGGPDSLTLLDMLSRFKDDYDLTLIAVYVHHGIRRAADREVAMVEQEAKRRQCLFVSRYVDVPKLAAATGRSVETAGREARYAIFKEIAVAAKAQAIAVAHQQNDQAETVLQHLLRGSGLAGLAGMRPKSGAIIRPLLALTRADVERYVSLVGLTPCEDETNSQLLYQRNRIRLELLPYLTQYNPAILADLNRLSDIARADEDCLELLAGRLYEAEVKLLKRGRALSRAVITAQPVALQRRLIRRLFQETRGSSRDISFAYTERIRELLDKPAGHAFEGQGLRVYTTAQDLCFIIAARGVKPVAAAVPAPVGIGGPGTYRFGRAVVHVRYSSVAPQETSHCLVRDGHACKGPLVLRGRQAGDTIALPGCTKSLKKYLNERQVPPEKRAAWPLLCQGHQVLWLCGLEASLTAAPQAATAAFIIFEFQEEDHA